jgi:hypothetical protein
MDPGDIAAFEGVASPLLLELGYEVLGEAPSPSSAGGE